MHPSGGYYFLLAAAVGMVRPIDVEPLTRDTLVLLETDFPTQCDAAPKCLVEDPNEWTLVDRFCFFSGGPINSEEDVFYQADFDGNPIYMLAFLSPSLTPAELYKIGETDESGEPAFTRVSDVEEVESVYDLTERDFDDLKLYHLGPCRALPQYILLPQAWTKILPPHFLKAKDEALRLARDYEIRHGIVSANHAEAVSLTFQRQQHYSQPLSTAGTPYVNPMQHHPGAHYHPQMVPSNVPHLQHHVKNGIPFQAVHNKQHSVYSPPMLPPPSGNNNHLYYDQFHQTSTSSELQQSDSQIDQYRDHVQLDGSGSPVDGSFDHLSSSRPHTLHNGHGLNHHQYHGELPYEPHFDPVLSQQRYDEEQYRPVLNQNQFDQTMKHSSNHPDHHQFDQVNSHEQYESMIVQQRNQYDPRDNHYQHHQQQYHYEDETSRPQQHSLPFKQQSSGATAVDTRLQHSSPVPVGHGYSQQQYDKIVPHYPLSSHNPITEYQTTSWDRSVPGNQNTHATTVDPNSDFQQRNDVDDEPSFIDQTAPIDEALASRVVTRSTPPGTATVRGPVDPPEDQPPSLSKYTKQQLRHPSGIHAGSHSTSNYNVYSSTNGGERGGKLQSSRFQNEEYSSSPEKSLGGLGCEYQHEESYIGSDYHYDSHHQLESDPPAKEYTSSNQLSIQLQNSSGGVGSSEDPDLVSRMTDTEFAMSPCGSSTVLTPVSDGLPTPTHHESNATGTISHSTSSPTNATSNSMLRSKRGEADGLPPHSPRSPQSSEMSQTSAFRGAQELLRRNRARRMSTARKDDGSVNDSTSGGFKETDRIHEPSDPTTLGPNHTLSEVESSSTWESASEMTSIVSGSSVWTDNENNNGNNAAAADRSKRRELILQMAKARMKSNNNSSKSAAVNSAITTPNSMSMQSSTMSPHTTTTTNIVKGAGSSSFSPTTAAHNSTGNVGGSSLQPLHQNQKVSNMVTIKQQQRKDEVGSDQEFFYEDEEKKQEYHHHQPRDSSAASCTTDINLIGDLD